jgi:hypothetical protein
MILNSGANPITVYGSNQEQIDNTGIGVPATQMASSVILYSCHAQAGWFSEGLPTPGAWDTD